MGNWFAKTDFHAVTKLENFNSDRLYRAIEALANSDVRAIEKSIFENICQIFGEDNSGVLYDGTNTHLHGSLSTPAAKGKDKEGVKNRLLVQIGMGVTKDRGIPIFHQVHAGNVHDTQMFKEAVSMFKERGLRAGLAIYDRGITSESIVVLLRENGWRSLAGIKNHLGVKQAISKMDFADLETYRNLVSLEGTDLFATSLPFKMERINGRLIIMLNPIKRRQLTTKRLRRIREFQESGDRIPGELRKFFDQRGRVNSHAVKRANAYEGLSFLFTDSRLKIPDAIKMYFAKDVIEKGFQCIKSDLGLRPINLQIDERIKGKIFVAYLAYNLITTFRLKLEDKGLNISPMQALRDLESIHRINGVTQREGRSANFSQICTLSNHQKALLKAVSPGLPVI